MEVINPSNTISFKKYLDTIYQDKFIQFFKYAIVRLNNQSDVAVDCVHETFEIAYRKIETLRNHPNVIGWFYKTLNNCIMRENSRKRLQIVCNDILVDLPSTYELLEDQITNRLYYYNIFSSLTDILTEDDLRLIHYRCEIQLTNKEISLLLNIQETTVKVRFFRLKKRICTFLNNTHFSAI